MKVQYTLMDCEPVIPPKTYQKHLWRGRCREQDVSRRQAPRAGCSPPKRQMQSRMFPRPKTQDVGLTRPLTYDPINDPKS
eukprot:478283-Amphidinium_carterae.1